MERLDTANFAAFYLLVTSCCTETLRTVFRAVLALANKEITPKSNRPNETAE
jgi:hypothetical protein